MRLEQGQLVIKACSTRAASHHGLLDKRKWAVKFEATGVTAVCLVPQCGVAKWTNAQYCHQHITAAGPELVNQFNHFMGSRRSEKYSLEPHACALQRVPPYTGACPD